MLEPVNDNHNTFTRIETDPAFSEGLLMYAYAKLPTSSYSFNDVATDDAVTNDKFNGYLRMATGQWTAQYNPVSNWNAMNEAITYLNLFIPQIDKVAWSWSNETINKMFKARLRGEAYALRGVFRYYLLQATAGKTASGELKGIPLIDEFQAKDANFNIGRASFSASVDSINSDFNKASKLLPLDFLDITSATQLPADYSTVNFVDYNKVFGKVCYQRISKRILMGFKAKLALLASSQAFNPDMNITLWTNAANQAAAVLAIIPGSSGINGMDATGNVYYQATLIDNLNVTGAIVNDSKEMLWRSTKSILSNSLEKRMLPPSLNGNGEINPTQNLVDAFPMKNGYPISHTLSGYNPASPYTNRDPRLGLYIVHNGLTFKTATIKTLAGGGVDAKDSIQTSTRTGYYLRKLIREDINFNNDGTNSGTKSHFSVHLRYTELFLNYAEAANEAWGPTTTLGSVTFTAKDVIAAIRKRAGITQPDAYLNTITTKEAMRELIRNERRLELCFEGFRFWDLRRWGLNLTETANGLNINKTATTFTTVPVEKRSYQSHMQYAPIPYSEILKYSALEQNSGW
jgi:hypothetical protein